MTLTERLLCELIRLMILSLQAQVAEKIRAVTGLPTTAKETLDWCSVSSSEIGRAEEMIKHAEAYAR